VQLVILEKINSHNQCDVIIIVSASSSLIVLVMMLFEIIFQSSGLSSGRSFKTNDKEIEVLGNVNRINDMNDTVNPITMIL
jgi:hypothetical protein